MGTIEVETYILQNPKDVCNRLIGAQITTSPHSVGCGLLVTYDLIGIPRQEDAMSISVRGCKTIFSKKWGKGGIWEKEDLNKIETKR